MIHAFRERREAEQEEAVTNIHLLACLMSYSVNDPKKMPKLKTLLPAKKQKAITEQEHQEMKKQGAACGMRVP